MRILVAIALAGCVSSTDEMAAPCEGKCDGNTTAQTTAKRDALLANLIAQMDRGTVMFGQQRFNLTGVNRDGTQWLATTSFDRSDARTVTGQHPVVLGLDAWDLAMKPATWTPTPATHASAAKAVAASGGIVTLDWHIVPYEIQQ